MEAKRPNRKGYTTDKTTLFEECDLKDFLDSVEPYEFLVKFNRVGDRRVANRFCVVHFKPANG